MGMDPRTRDTLVVRTDDNQFQLFTYDRGTVRIRSLALGTRVRVTAGPADENGTRSASNVTVLAAPSAADKGAQRWRIGVRGGAAFDPEL